MLNKYFYMDFGEKIKFFAKEKFGSLQELSTVLGTSPQNLSRYVNGSVEPTKVFFIKMKELGCDMNWLLGETDNDMVIAEPTPQYLSNIKEIDVLKGKIRQIEEKLKELQDIINK